MWRSSQSFACEAGLRLPTSDVTFAATERRVDSIVADEAVGHLREICVADFVRAFKPSMASGAGICGVEIGTVHVGGLSQVCS